MISDPIRVCELIVGLPDVNVLGVEDLGADAPLRLHIESRGPRPEPPRVSCRLDRVSLDLMV